MSSEIELPDGVSAFSAINSLTVKGPKGESTRKLSQHGVSLRIDNNKIILEAERQLRKNKKMIGAMNAHIRNMIKGSLQNHAYTLKICSGHFPMNVSITGNKLVIKNFLGEKVPRTLEFKNGVQVKVDGDLIHVVSNSKELAGQVSADIEQLTRRPGYDTRVFQDGCYIISKDGKELK
jgi:large subunit ribosomal protein L6